MRKAANRGGNRGGNLLLTYVMNSALLPWGHHGPRWRTMSLGFGPACCPLPQLRLSSQSVRHRHTKYILISEAARFCGDFSPTTLVLLSTQ